MKEALSTTFTGMFSLLIAATLSAAIMGGFRLGLPEAQMENPFDVASQAEAAGVEIVDTAQMREIVETGSHLILDAREASAYDQAHIPTAMSVSVHQFEESFPQIAPMLQADSPLAVYCTGPYCDDGLRLILRMREAGFTGAVLYLEGMEGWE
ncbi:rhodanese-like domain-containing protein [Kiritimatiellaeota bacterium B1221]|nr:rhodanese-like domain-containing protein [Kiritimatiellaeota bacterium B1221]